MRRLTDVDLRLIRIFRAIVQCEGLAGAELVLNLSQSRISAGLAELEARLGTRLCRRGRSGFTLTEAGMLVHEASEDLFGAVEHFCDRAATVSTKLRRVLRLGTVDAVVSNEDLSLSLAICRFRDQNPSVVIEFTTASPEVLEQQIIAGKRDLVVMPCTNRKSELSYLPLLEERQALYCARTHPLAQIPDEEICDERLSRYAFVARGYLHHSDLKRIGRREEQATVDMMEAQLVLILSGNFIGYLPAHYARTYCERGELRSIREDRYGYDSTFYLVAQHGGPENTLLERFCADLEHQLRSRRYRTAGHVSPA